MNHTRSGFTFIEIVIALAIVGLLGAVLVPGYMAWVERGKRQATDSTVKTLKTAIAQFNLDTNKYPRILTDLIRRPADETISKKWRGPYVEADEIPEDSWGNSFVYRPTSDKFELYSHGPKGTEGAKEDRIGIFK